MHFPVLYLKNITCNATRQTNVSQNRTINHCKGVTFVSN